MQQITCKFGRKYIQFPMGIPQRFINSTPPVYCKLPPPAASCGSSHVRISQNKTKTQPTFPETLGIIYILSRFAFWPFFAKFNTCRYFSGKLFQPKTHSPAHLGGKFIIDARLHLSTLRNAFHFCFPFFIMERYRNFPSLSVGDG